MKKGEYDHHGVDLHVELNAPIIMLCENIFEPSKPIAVLDAGLLKLVTKLVKHDKNVNYKEMTRAD